MFGFIFRCYIQHPDDEENHLIYLQLSYRYEETGIFEAGKSYMIRSKTKNEFFSMMYEIMHFKKISIPKSHEVGPWCPTPGYYTIRQQREMYIIALHRYVSSLTQIDETFRYITDADKKLSYLDNKLSKLKPYYEKRLFRATYKHGPFFITSDEGKYSWLVYDSPKQ
ncbi:MAG: hypothetical protein JW943_10485 [Deltaproteobacteria bacterium]|nr:hypothetical protein [Deltaproteobacteria bacterium]